MSVKARAHLFRRKYPGVVMSGETLRRVYKASKVRLRKVSVKAKTPRKALNSRREQLLSVLPQMIAEQDTDTPLYFLDETMFTASDRLDRVWAPRGDMVCLTPNVERF